MRLLFLLFFIINLSGCYQNKALTENTLVYCTDSIPTSFNPQISHDAASLDASTHQLFNRLVKIDPTTHQFLPDLAESWEQSNDNLRYRFTLRERVSFHHTDYFKPSRYVTVDDVLFSFNRMLDAQHPFHAVNEHIKKSTSHQPVSNFLSHIKKIDDKTVEFVLLKPDITILDNLASHYSVIHSAEYANQLLRLGHPEKIDFSPIGTGPFKLKNFSNNGAIRLQQHTESWQPLTHIKNLIYVTNLRATKRYSKLLSGQCDVIAAPATSQLATIRNKGDVYLNSESTASIALWAFNTEREELKDNKVRQALSKAIDKEAILKAVYYQNAIKTDRLLTNFSWALKAPNKDDIYNPQVAKNNLIALGYNFDKIITILLPEKIDIFNPILHKTAQLIRSNLADVGIESIIIGLTGEELTQRLADGHYDTYLHRVDIHTNDPDSTFRPLISCNVLATNGNSSQWCSAPTQQLLDASLTEPSLVKRLDNYYRIQDTMYEQRPYLPIAHVLRLDAISESIQGIEVNPLTGINFQYATKQYLD